MTPDAQLEDLERIIELLDRNIRRAIRLSEYFDRAAYSGDDVKAHFDNSVAADGYNTVLDAVYFELIITVARLFDDPTGRHHADTTASIPVVLHVLEHDILQEALRQRLLKRHDPSNIKGLDSAAAERMRPRMSERVEEQVQSIPRLLAEYTRLKGDHLLQRVRVARNEVLAHTATNPTKNSRIAYGDAEQLLAKAIPLVAGLQSSVRSCHLSYEEERTDSKELASEFWAKVIAHT